MEYLLRLLARYDTKINEKQTPLRVSLNNSVIEGSVQGVSVFQ